MRGVADGHGERIAGILGTNGRFQPQQGLDHDLHLVLFGAAVAYHAGFDFER